MTAPVVLATGTVTWRVLSTAVDGPDAGTAPDQVGGGHVTFVPASRHLPVSGATVFLTNRVHVVDAAGVLAPVTLEAGTWTAHYRGPAGDLLLSVPFTLAAGQTLDLADSVPAAVVNATALAKGDRGPAGPPGPQGPAGAVSDSPATALGNQLTKAGVVLDHGAAGEFDSQIVESLFPFIDPESGRIAGVYTGYGLTGGSLAGSIGLAYSDDGVTWEKAGQLLAASGTPGAPDEAGRTGPVVVVQDGIFYVFHIGLTAVGYEGGTKRLLCSSTPSLTDPVWTHHGVMLSPGGTGWRQQAVWHPSIVRVGDLLYCFINATGADSKERIGVATATTLTGPWTWGNGDAPVFTADPGVDIIGDPAVRRVPGGWRMDYFTAGGGSASDWFTTTTPAAFPGGWDDHPGAGDVARRTIAPGPVGSFDALYAHKPSIFTYAGRLFHYYTAVMAGDTNRRVALACDPPLPVGGASTGTVTPVVPGSFCQVRSTDTAADLYLTGGGAYARLDGLPKARVQARPGDLLDLRLAYVANNQGGDCRVDAVTVNAADAAVNYISGTGATGRGYLGWNVLGGRYDVGSGTTSYIVQAADVIDGTVTVVPVFRCDGDFRVIFNNAADKTFFAVRNLGPTL